MKFKIGTLILVTLFSVASNAAIIVCVPAAPEDGCAPGQFSCSRAGWIGPSAPSFCSDSNVGRPTHFEVKIIEVPEDSESHLSVSDSVESL